MGTFQPEAERTVAPETSSQSVAQRQTVDITDELEAPPAYDSHAFRPSSPQTTSSPSSTSTITRPSDGLLGSGKGPTDTPYSSHGRPHPRAESQENSGYARVEPMAVEPRDHEPGCCFSDTGGCCFSHNNACCFSDHDACFFSDHEGCCFSDHGGCFFSDHGGCFFSDHGGRCFSDKGSS